MQEVNNKNSYTYKKYRKLVRIDSVKALVILVILMISFIIDLLVYLLIPGTYYIVICLELVAFILMRDVDRAFSKRINYHYSTWGRGAGSELITQKKLRELGSEYSIINDFQYKYGNVDHICIGPTGIFVIETKSHKGVISYDGQKLLRDGVTLNKDFLKQTKRSAVYISEYISNKINKKYFVIPILVFNSAKVNESIRKQIEGVWIGGRGFQNYVIKKNKEHVLSEKEIHNILNVINNDSENYNKVNQKNVNNEFMISCFSGRVKIIKKMIENRINIDAVDSYGKTPLMLACYNGHIEVVEILINQGADVNKKNEYGWTALTYARNDGYDEIIKILKKAGATE